MASDIVSNDFVISVGFLSLGLEPSGNDANGDSSGVLGIHPSALSAKRPSFTNPTLKITEMFKKSLRNLATTLARKSQLG
jgi:hypothetical protein